MNLLRKLIAPPAGIIIAIAAIAIACTFAFDRVHASGSSVISQASAVATTTVTYMTPGTATTTYQIDGTYLSGKVPNLSEIDAAALYIQYNASSSASTLGWKIEYSNNGIDWYGENSTITNPAGGTNPVAGESTSTISHYWTPGAAGTAYKAVQLPATPTIHERVTFFTPVGTANGAVYNEVVLKRSPSTP